MQDHSALVRSAPRIGASAIVPRNTRSSSESELRDVDRLGAFGAIGEFELHGLALGE